MPRLHSLPLIQFDTTTEDQLRAELLANKRKFLPELTDENASGVMTRLINLVSRFIITWLRDFINAELNETFLPTATKYDAIYKRCKEFGYTPEQETPATATVTITLLSALTNGLIITKAGTRFQTARLNNSNPISFELVEDQVIFPAGSAAGSQHTIAVIQGETVTETLGTSDGESRQEYITLQGYVIENSLKVYVDGVEWTKVDNMFLSDPEDTHWELLGFDENGKAMIGFGTGDGDAAGHGLIPDNEAEITCEYRTLPGEVNGNVAAGTITRTVPSTSLFTVTNVAAASGWYDREDIEDARWAAMRKHRTKDTLVKNEDYVAQAEDLDNVGRAYAVPNTHGENTMTVFCILEDGSLPDRDELLEIEAALGDLSSANETLLACQAQYSEFDLSAVITIDSNYGEDTVIAAVEDALDDYFDPNNYDDSGNRTIKNGVSIFPANIYKIIMGVDGVTNCTISAPTAVVSVATNQLPALGTVSITAE